MKAMSDIEGLVKDLRAVAYDVYPATRLDAADALEAQAAELTRLREQCEAKDAEIERLKAERGWFEGLVKSHDILERLATLSAENERLRKALEKISEHPESYPPGKLMVLIKSIAREVLAAHVGEEK
jgi:SMC interacting uncharacterized protein involved in chromosome segregation